MEIKLILGPNSSGKSLYAENIAAKHSSSPVYIATMVPYTEENHKRIEKHIKQREDKNFTVFEVPFDVCNTDVGKEDIVLLEDVSNLLANGIFTQNKTADDALHDIIKLAEKCKMLVAVNISGLSAEGYNGETAQYIDGINYLNKKLSEIAAEVVKMENSIPVKIK